MPVLCDSTVQHFVDRFGKVTPDAKPLWGKMTGAQMLGHVTLTLRYTLGDVPLLPFRGTFTTQYLFAPLVLNGIVKIPKNVPVPRTQKAAMPMPDGDLDSLKQALEQVLQESRDGSFRPAHHPYFGSIGPKKWMKFHGVHMDHHLRQFGV